MVKAGPPAKVFYTGYTNPVAFSVAFLHTTEIMCISLALYVVNHCSKNWVEENKSTNHCIHFTYKKIWCVLHV